MIKRLKFLSILCLTLFLFGHTNAQEGQGVTLLSELFIGGRYDELKIYGDYCYVTNGYGFVIYDISDPTSPQPIRQVSTPAYSKDIDIEDGILYVVERITYCLSAFSLEDPEAPELLDRYPVTGFGLIDAYGDLICVENGRALGLYRFNQRNELSHISTINNLHVYNFVLLDTMLFTRANSGVFIFSIIDPVNPVRLNYFREPRLTDFTVAGDFIYGYSSDVFKIIDISDIENPTLRGECEIDWGSTVYVQNQYAYMPIHIVDISDPDRPEVVTEFNLGIQSNYDLSGNIACDVSLDILRVYDFSDIYNPEIAGTDTSIYHLRNTISFQLVDDLLYFATRERSVNDYRNYISRLRVISLEDPSNPVEVGSLLSEDPDISFYKFIIVDDYLYAFLSHRIIIVSIADPEEPRILNQVEMRELNSDIFVMKVYGDYIYCIRGMQLYVLSIKDRENPTLVGIYEYIFGGHYGISGLDVDDNYVYVSGSHGAILIYQRNEDGTLSSVLRQRYIGGFESLRGIFLYDDDTAFMYSYDDVLLLVVFLEGRRGVNVIRRIQIPDEGLLQFHNGYFFQLVGGKFQILNIEDPENPRITGWYDTPGTASDLRIKDNDGIVIVKDGTSFGIYDCSEALSIKEEPSSLLPHQTDLQAYPNPFNSTTTISYNISSPALTSLSIYDLQGHRVAGLHNYDKSAGVHSITWDASGLPSGIYICKITSSNHTSAIKLVVMR